MADKKINYTARTYDDFKSELIKFSNMYYPELSDSFNDASVGAWFIDLISSVSDDLSYHIDRAWNESNINAAQTKKSLLNSARTNGVKVPGPKCSICEVRFTCELPTDSTNIHLPNWDLAPIIKRSTVVNSGSYTFECTEDVNFAEQFNSDGYSNRTYEPKRDSNGTITGYTVSKTSIVINGTTRVYKKVLTDEEVKPFMEIVLPEKNIANVESIIFKTTSDFTSDPKVSEYYIDSEEYDSNGSKTYRYFEVDSLADQYRFGTVMDNNSESYVDYTEDGDDGSKRTTRVYKGEWKALQNKFITEYTDNGYLKVIFGASNGIETTNGDTTFAKYQMSKIINNDMLGIIPQAGWTMYVLYRISNGAQANVAQGAINTISYLSAELSNPTAYNGKDGTTQRSNVINSISVTNTSIGVGGKDAPSTEEIKYLTKYNTSSQNRCVTVKDYQAQILQLPPKYGCPFRSSVIEENNKIAMSFLGIDVDGNLTTALPLTLVNNMIEYLSNYRQINDYIEIKSGKIYNLKFEVNVFIDKNYNTADVIVNVINTIKDYMDVNNHQMGEDIFVGDLEKEITSVDGVISLIKLRIYSVYGNGYGSKSSLPMKIEGGNCGNSSDVSNNTENQYEIDLDAIDYVLYGEYNAMYEILNDSDIEVKCKLR